MVLKKFFGRDQERKEHEYTIDDLIVLERYAEAVDKLQVRIKARDDLHDHLKLADCYTNLRQIERAIDEYLYVADVYANDGFYDRALAVLGKARRLNPMHEEVPKKQQKLDRLKNLEVKRTAAQEGFMARVAVDTEAKGTAVVEFQSIWTNVAKTRLIQELGEDQCRLLFEGAKPVHFLTPGKQVVTRGESRDILYIIVSGVIVAWVEDVAGVRTDIRSFGPGDVIGDGALFAHTAWPANFSSGSRATLLSLDQAGLEVCLTGNPDPRRFIDLLRQGNADRDVAQSIAKLGL